MHELTLNQAFSIWFYKLLLIIEALQFIWYAFHPNFNFLWDSGVFDSFQDFIRYFQVLFLSYFFGSYYNRLIITYLPMGQKFFYQ